MAVGTLPILAVGLGIKFFWAQGYEQSPLRSIPSIAIISIVMALLLALAERVGARHKQLPSVSGRDGLVVGLAQALALLPGVSRSGSTLTAALFDGSNAPMRPAFPFAGHSLHHRAGPVQFKDALSAGCRLLLVGIVSAAVVSWLAIDWLLKFLQRASTWIFVAYRLLFGMLLLVWCGAHGAH